MGVIQRFVYRKKASMNLSITYILIAILAAATGQILLKQGVTTIGALTITLGQLGDILWRLGTNPYVIIGLTAYVVGELFWLAALSRVDLSYAYPFASLSYVFMLAASWLVFNEDISWVRLLGTVIIGLGVFLVSRS
jgi:drug/metabolite transporter (DMT)-like permease